MPDDAADEALHPDRDRGRYHRAIDDGPWAFDPETGGPHVVPICYRDGSRIVPPVLDGAPSAP